MQINVNLIKDFFVDCVASKAFSRLTFWHEMTIWYPVQVHKYMFLYVFVNSYCICNYSHFMYNVYNVFPIFMYNISIKF